MLLFSTIIVVFYVTIFIVRKD